MRENDGFHRVQRIEIQGQVLDSNINQLADPRVDVLPGSRVAPWGKHLVSEHEQCWRQILRLLKLNLFEKRDLIALLQGDPPIMQRLNIQQMALL